MVPRFPEGAAGPWPSPAGVPQGVLQLRGGWVGFSDSQFPSLLSPGQGGPCRPVTWSSGTWWVGLVTGVPRILAFPGRHGGDLGSALDHGWQVMVMGTLPLLGTVPPGPQPELWVSGEPEGERPPCVSRLL